MAHTTMNKANAIKFLRMINVSGANGREVMEALDMAVDALTVHTSKWIGDYCPYTCPVCGKHSDSKVPYCCYCGEPMEVD